VNNHGSLRCGERARWSDYIPAMDNDVTHQQRQLRVQRLDRATAALNGDAGRGSLADESEPESAGASHIYTLTVNVDMDLAGGGGDDVYDRCLPTPDGAPDQGLFNRDDADDSLASAWPRRRRLWRSCRTSSTTRSS
jgi:hypothetical protein